MCAPVDWTILPVPFESYSKDVYETSDPTLENRVPFMVCARVIVGKPLSEADIVGTGAVIREDWPPGSHDWSTLQN